MTKKYANTKWTEYSIDDVEIETEELRHRMFTDTQEHNLVTSTGKRFYSLSALYTKEVYPELTPPIILDEDELKATRAYMRKAKKKKPTDIVKYLKSLPDKRIYMRMVCSNKNWQRRQVFTHDAIEVIDVLLKRLQIKVKKFEVRMEKHRKRWENNDDVSRENFTTISVFQFQEALDDFDIDKSLITLVPDIFFVYQVKYQCHVATKPGLVTLGPAGDRWVDGHQAILMLFQDIVMEVNWREDVECTKHEHCAKPYFRQRILDMMRNYEQYGDWSCLRRSTIINDINHLKQTCNYRLRERKPFTLGLELLFCDFSDKITIEYFVEKCGEFGFAPANLSGLPDLKNVLIPVWRARVLLMLLWTDIFFNAFYPRLKSIVIDAIAFKIPFIHWKDGLNPMDVIISQDDDVLEQESLTAGKNAVDLTEHAKEMRSLIGEYTTFTHPWMHGEVVDRWLCDPNIHRCGKWNLRESTCEMRNGRSVSKSPARIEKLIEDYMIEARKEFEENKEKEKQMAKEANGILRRILIKPVVLNKEKEKVEMTVIEKPEEPEEQLATDCTKLTNNLDALAERLFVCKKSGINQWKVSRDVRHIIRDVVTRHYHEMIQEKNEVMEKHERLMKKNEELKKNLSIAKIHYKVQNELRDPSEPSTSTAAFTEN